MAVAIDASMVGEGYGDWDLEYRGRRIEVKAAGDVQSWPQKQRSPVSFGIAPTEGSIEQPDGSYLSDRDKKRRSDAYVFCHHIGVVPDDPRDWAFYVAPTKRIDDECGGQKAIALTSLVRKLEPIAVGAQQLRAAVDTVLEVIPPGWAE